MTKTDRIEVIECRFWPTEAENLASLIERSRHKTYSFERKRNDRLDPDGAS